MMKRILVILTALCLVCSFALAEEMPAPATVSAVGSAALEGSTQAVLSCELNTFGPTVAEAQALMQRQLDTLRDVLKQQGVEAKDIASTRYDVHGKYDYHYTKLTETEVLSGYDVTVTLQARVADAHDLGTIIGEPPGNDPNGFGDVANFRLGNSGLYMSVSTKQFFRPDRECTDRLVEPDVKCESREAMEVLYILAQ